MSSEIIQLSAFRPKFGVKSRNAALPTSSDRPCTAAGYFLKEPATDTAKNQRLRGDRRDVWREADAVMKYWHLSMKMDGVISCVQRHGTPEGDLHPTRDPKDYWKLVVKYRQAWARLMLTPAPDMRSVTWKRAELKAENHKPTDLKTERIERAIADDVEFLKEHPTRQTRGLMDKAREWKTAFRARVTLYAEQNGIDKSELAWLGRIKHEHLAAFADRYGLSYEWLLEGRERRRINFLPEK